TSSALAGKSRIYFSRDLVEAMFFFLVYLLRSITQEVGHPKHWIPVLILLTDQTGINTEFLGRHDIKDHRPPWPSRNTLQDMNYCALLFVSSISDLKVSHCLEPGKLPKE
ncbi:hypothetical protein J6590_081788, partial [Homalodisca vitripennis]